MSPGEQLLEALGQLNSRATEFKAFEATLRELNSTLVDLLSAKEAQQAPDIAGPLLAAMQSLKFPAITVPAPSVQVAPQLVTPPGAQWSIEAERTPKGFRMTVTKL